MREERGGNVLVDLFPSFIVIVFYYFMWARRRCPLPFVVFLMLRMKLTRKRERHGGSCPWMQGKKKSTTTTPNKRRISRRLQDKRRERERGGEERRG
jgi:hypothetical protein